MGQKCCRAVCPCCFPDSGEVTPLLKAKAQTPTAPESRASGGLPPTPADAKGAAGDDCSALCPPQSPQEDLRGKPSQVSDGSGDHAQETAAQKPEIAADDVTDTAPPTRDKVDPDETVPPESRESLTEEGVRETATEHIPTPQKESSDEASSDDNAPSPTAEEEELSDALATIPPEDSSDAEQEKKLPQPQIPSE